MKNMSENIGEMISSIANGDTESAIDSFQYIISQKVADRLEDYKSEVADQYFNGMQTEEVESKE